MRSNWNIISVVKRIKKERVKYNKKVTLRKEWSEVRHISERENECLIRHISERENACLIEVKGSLEILVGECRCFLIEWAPFNHFLNQVHKWNDASVQPIQSLSFYSEDCHCYLFFWSTARRHSPSFNSQLVELSAPPVGRFTIETHIFPSSLAPAPDRMLSCLSFLARSARPDFSAFPSLGMILWNLSYQARNPIALRKRIAGT